MTEKISPIKYQNMMAFQTLATVGFNPDSIERSDALKVELTDTDDDIVMLIGDDIDINAKDGNNTVCIKGNNTNISAGNGNNSIGVNGDVSKITTGDGNNNFYVRGDDTNVTTLDGNNTFRIYGDNASVTAGVGRNQFGIIGDNMKLYSESDLSSVAFWGDNFDITVGKGTAVRTVDFALKETRDFDDMEVDFIARLEHFNTSQKVNSIVQYDYSTCDNPLIAMLSPEDQEFVRNHDMLEKKNNCAKYIITENEDGAPTIYVYGYSYGGKNMYYPKGHEGDPKFRRHFDQNEVCDTIGSYDKYDDYAMIYNKNYIVDGCYMTKGVNFIEDENIKNTTLKYTLSGSAVENINYSYLDGDKRFEQETAYTFAQQSGQKFLTCERETNKFYTTKITIVTD